MIPSAFNSANDAALRLGRRPVVFDILRDDQETSLLPDNLKLVLHVNPSSMQFSYSKAISRIQTRGGFVEQHWGDAAEEISFSQATGGFVRVFTGLSNITGSGAGTRGRRETIAYSKFEDLLALFHNNGAVYDSRGTIVVQGYIQVSFDEGIFIGWFDGDFVVTETADKPYQFEISSRFIIDKEILRFKTAVFNSTVNAVSEAPQTTGVLPPLFEP